MAVYDPNEHTPLSGQPWSVDVASAAITHIVEATQQNWTARASFGVHPEDDDGRGVQPGIYFGVAGALLAIDRLRRFGYSHTLELPEIAGATLASYSDGGNEPWMPASYMLGPLGLYLAGAITGNYARKRTVLLDTIERNLANQSHEIFIGMPGSMIAASLLYRRTGDVALAQLWRHGFEATFRAWREVAEGVFLWDQHLYGRDVPSYVGAGHGFAGTAEAMLDATILEESEREEVCRRAISTVNALAVHDGSFVNWPGIFPSAPPRWPLQWCHGAPGIVTSLSAIAPKTNERFDGLLVAAGETVWAAGPLAKGAGLCHGTSGNGFAFLKLYRRTGDLEWLERARAFAMHALAQMQSEHERFEHNWPSLWTGDLGVALYLAACIDGSDRILTIDEI